MPLLKFQGKRGALRPNNAANKGNDASEHLLSARHCLEPLARNNSFNPNSHPKEGPILLQARGDIDSFLKIKYILT